MKGCGRSRSHTKQLRRGYIHAIRKEKVFNMKIHLRKAVFVLMFLLPFSNGCGGDENNGGNIGYGSDSGGGNQTANPVSISISPQTERVEAGGTVTLTVNAVNTDIVWPDNSSFVYVINGNQATFTPPKNEGTYDFTVTAMADPTKSVTAKITVFFSPFPTESAAADYLERRVADMDRRLYVYKDFVDGVNNFTQKMWMGDSSKNIPPMNEKAAGFSGVSGIAAELDLGRHLWGGYMFINGALPPGTTVAINDPGNFDAGLDLTGAEKLVFYARGETGSERVEFFMGGLGWDGKPYPDSAKRSLGYVSLTTEWKKFEIPLNGLDLSRIGCGFGWVANDTNNPRKNKVKFYVDDIYYEFSQDDPKPVFLQSYAPVAPGTDGDFINGFAYLYDNAVAAMALSYAGKHERARQIADAIVYALENDRYYSDGRLRNAYANGDPRSFRGWFSPRGREFARMPGNWITEKNSAGLEFERWVEDYYANSSSTGNMAWAILALCEVYKNAPGREEYLRAARKIGELILTLRDDRNGGFAGGWEGFEKVENEADKDKEVRLVTYKSTEHNIDLIAAYRLLAKYGDERKYTDASNYARDFVLSMYDTEINVFYTGTEADGVTINKSVLPLDSNTWALLALEDFADGEKVMDFVERNMRVSGGYDFNEDMDGIWFEGTAQVALAYKQVKNSKECREIIRFLNDNALVDGSIYAADRDGVTTGFNVGGTDRAWKYDRRAHVGATGWLAFAQLGRNPFE